MKSAPETDRNSACPYCHQRLATDGLAVGGTIRCPNCLNSFILVHIPREATPATFHKWIMLLALGLLGSLCPLVMLVTMALTLVLGPFALVIAPLVALAIAILSCGYVHLRAGSRWFWYYTAMGLMFSIIIQFWPSHIQPEAQPGASGFVLAQASIAATLLHRLVTGLWLFAAGYVWFRNRIK
jgi:hypothetical protein